MVYVTRISLVLGPEPTSERAKQSANVTYAILQTEIAGKQFVVKMWYVERTCKGREAGLEDPGERATIFTKSTSYVRNFGGEKRQAMFDRFE
jgi:hypothetical protein